MPGPFGVAWVDESETAFIEGTHFRYDEAVVEFNLEHSEGDFATLTMRAENPHIGLLHPSRKIWLWLSYDTGAGVEPIFFGRLVGVPDGLIGATVSLVFTGQPADYLIRKHTLAQTLKVRPYYDAIGIDEAKRDDPDAVIEGYSARYHIDRVTHDVTISDANVGEDGIEVFEDGVPWNSLQIRPGVPPIPSVTFEGSVTWPNASTGTLPSMGYVFRTLTGDSLLSDWPKDGASLGGGWFVQSASIRDDWGSAGAPVVNFKSAWRNRETDHDQGDTLTVNYNTSTPTAATALKAILTLESSGAFMDPFNPDFVDITNSTFHQSYMIVADWSLTADLTLRYEAGQSRIEKVRGTLNADFQPILTVVPSSAAAAQAEEIIQNDGCDISVPLLQNDFITGLPLTPENPPIGDASRTSFFSQERGHQFIEYLIALARAKILMSARGVEIDFVVPFERALALSCRKNATVVHSRIPGGTATGKIMSYTISAKGNGADMRGTVKVGVPIGQGGHAEAADGIETYVDAGYVDAGYQYMAGAMVAPGIGDVAYSVPAAATNPDGFVFPLTADQVVLRNVIVGSASSQLAILNTFTPPVSSIGSVSAQQTSDQANAAASAYQANLAHSLEDDSVYLDLQLRSVDNANFGAEYLLTLSPMFAPQGIDLSAPSSP